MSALLQQDDSSEQLSEGELVVSELLEMIMTDVYTQTCWDIAAKGKRLSEGDCFALETITQPGGLQWYMYIGILVHWWYIGILVVYWYIGILVYWCIGTLVYWCIGTLVYWCIGILVYWCIGVLVYWYIGTLVYWYIGILVYWLNSLFFLSDDSFYPDICSLVWTHTPSRSLVSYVLRDSHIELLQMKCIEQTASGYCGHYALHFALCLLEVSQSTNKETALGLLGETASSGAYWRRYDLSLLVIVEIMYLSLDIGILYHNC